MTDSSDDPVSKRVLASVEIFKLCDSLAYFDRFLSKGIYEDGRPIDSFTKLTFKVRIYSSQYFLQTNMEIIA